MKSTKNGLMIFITTAALFLKSNGTEVPRRVSRCREIRVAVLFIPPLTKESSNDMLTGIIGDFFQKIITKCFRFNDKDLDSTCFQHTVFDDARDFQASILNNRTDIAFPISARMKKVLSDQTNDVKLIFHELMEIPGYYLIMDTEHINGKVNDIAMRRLVENTWPIMVFTILLAGISGMCVWILETFFNEEEFPRSFTRGTYEGFWWAFVSMTTVGYGDKTPKFVFGRLFGVIWILFGLIVIAVFTATATSSLSISATDLAVVGGRKIGVLVNTSAELQARQRGAKVNVFTTVDKVFSKLKENKIDGVFMERYRAAYYLSEALNDSTFKVFGSYDHEVVYDVAVRDSPSAKSQMGKGSCFERELERFDVDDILLDYLKPVDVYEGSDLQSFLSGKSKGTQNFLLVTLGIFVGLLFSGFITELLYIKLWKPTRKVQSREGEIDLNEARTQSDFTKAINLKDVEDKLGQLIREISKLQEQLTVISSQANGFYNTGQDTAYM